MPSTCAGQAGPAGGHPVNLSGMCKVQFRKDVKKVVTEKIVMQLRTFLQERPSAESAPALFELDIYEALAQCYDTAEKKAAFKHKLDELQTKLVQDFNAPAPKTTLKVSDCIRHGAPIEDGRRRGFEKLKVIRRRS